MVVDCHVHMRGDPYRSGGFLQGSRGDIDTPEQILALMDEAGVHRAIVFPTFELHPDNDGLAAAVNARPERFIGFAWLNPHEGDLAVQELERLVLDHGFRGVKLHPLLHAFRANDEAVVVIAAPCSEYEQLMEAMVEGAYDFLPEDADGHQLRLMLGRAMEHCRLRRQCHS